MASLDELRQEIDVIDDSIAELFTRRMATVKSIGELKSKIGAKTLAPDRERQILLRIGAQVPPELSTYSRVLMNTLFDLSRAYQQRFVCAGDAPLSVQIRQARELTPRNFPDSARVACQGIAGAYSQLACDKLFPVADIMYFKSFDAVFTAVEKGFCKYGVLPIENSSYGAVNQVYELMREHKFYIVRDTKLQISHALMAKPGTKLSEIREIFSHEQALGQCSKYVSAHPEITFTVCENTAVAARLVAESGRSDVASISSPECARLYELGILEPNVRNEMGNYTRFICIARDMEIYPGSRKVSMMMTTEHRPGALHAVLARLSSLGINISKLESRPIPGQDFEFLFYFDLDASTDSEDVVSLLGELSRGSEMFSFLGAYTEI